MLYDRCTRNLTNTLKTDCNAYWTSKLVAIRHTFFYYKKMKCLLLTQWTSLFAQKHFLYILKITRNLANKIDLRLKVPSFEKISNTREKLRKSVERNIKNQFSLEYFFFNFSLKKQKQNQVLFSLLLETPCLPISHFIVYFEISSCIQFV